jgi:hypothetical protein
MSGSGRKQQILKSKVDNSYPIFRTRANLAFYIQESLRVFTRFPQTSRVYFGGGHDNGYTSTLNQIQTEGLHNKITILRGYKDIAYELRSLNLPFLEIEGVFITKKLQNTHKKFAPATAEIIDNSTTKASDAMEGDNIYMNGRPRQHSVGTAPITENWQQQLSQQPVSTQAFWPRPAPPQPPGGKLPTPNLVCGVSTSIHHELINIP